jgi:hypothetical protein
MDNRLDSYKMDTLNQRKDNNFSSISSTKVLQIATNMLLYQTTIQVFAKEVNN